PEHPAPGRLELPGRDAGTAADVEDVGAWAGRDDPLHQRAGIARPGPVVAFGVRAERLRYLPRLMSLTRLGSGNRCWLRRYSGEAPPKKGRLPPHPPGPGPGRKESNAG